MNALLFSQVIVQHAGVTWAELLGDLFAGIAAIGGAFAVFFAKRTVDYSRSTLDEARVGARDAHLAHEQEQRERQAQLTAELRHQRLAQAQRVVQLTTALAMIEVESAGTPGPSRYGRYNAVRLELLAALSLFKLLGGSDLPLCQSIASNIGIRPAAEINAAQLEIVTALDEELALKDVPEDLH